MDREVETETADLDNPAAVQTVHLAETQAETNAAAAEGVTWAVNARRHKQTSMPDVWNDWRWGVEAKQTRPVNLNTLGF